MIQGSMGSASNQNQPSKTQQQIKRKQENNSLEKLALKEQKKRKNRHRKKHKKEIRDPEEVREVQLQRLKAKREQYWDSRFVKETIPDLFTKSKRKRTQVTRILHSPLQLKIGQIERVRFPELGKQHLQYSAQRNSENLGISFKVKHLKKEGESIDFSKRASLSHGEQKSKRNIELQNKKRLQAKLQQKAKMFQINQQYKNMLQDIIERSIDKKYKSARQILQKQIDSIGSPNNNYSSISKLVQQRRRMLKAIKENDEDLKLYLELQVQSLILVQQILKYKAFWEGVYRNNFYLERKISFYFTKSINYLTEMGKQVAQIAKGDPFLVSSTEKLRRKMKDPPKQGKNQIMLKIRACELLLIEQELLSIT